MVLAGAGCTMGLLGPFFMDILLNFDAIRSAIALLASPVTHCQCILGDSHPCPLLPHLPSSLEAGSEGMVPGLGNEVLCAGIGAGIRCCELWEWQGRGRASPRPPARQATPTGSRPWVASWQASSQVSIADSVAIFPRCFSLGLTPSCGGRTHRLQCLLQCLLHLCFGHWANVDSMLVHAMVKVAVLATMYYICYVLECKGWLANSGGWKGMTLKLPQCI